MQYQGANACEACYRRLSAQAMVPDRTPRLHLITVDDVTRTPDRQTIRKYIGEWAVDVKRRVDRGENAQHIRLDQQDAIEKFAMTVPEGERETFARIFAEELEAASETARQQNEVRQIEEIKSAGAQRGVWIGLFLAVIFVILPLMSQNC